MSCCAAPLPVLPTHGNSSAAVPDTTPAAVLSRRRRAAAPKHFAKFGVRSVCTFTAALLGVCAAEYSRGGGLARVRCGICKGVSYLGFTCLRMLPCMPVCLHSISAAPSTPRQRRRNCSDSAVPNRGVSGRMYLLLCPKLGSAGRPLLISVNKPLQKHTRKAAGASSDGIQGYPAFRIQVARHAQPRPP